MLQTSSTQSVSHQHLTEVRGPLEGEDSGNPAIYRSRPRHRRVVPSDLALYAAIVGRTPEMDFDPEKALADDAAAQSVALARPGRNWSVMTLCVYLKQVSTQTLAEQMRRLSGMRRESVTAFAKRFSQRALNSLGEAQSRLNRFRDRR